ncbi:MAG TPA: hypothetical protein VGM20_11170 [Gemmatimonadales bacterium]|jgi:Tfp pilus assembly protein PilE
MLIIQMAVESAVRGWSMLLWRARHTSRVGDLWRAFGAGSYGPAVAISPRQRAERTGRLVSQTDLHGFTTLELTMVVVILGILTAMVVPQVSRYTEKSEAGRAAMVVQQDLERSFALAARLRQPMVLTADNTQHIYQVKDQTDDSVRLTRRLSLGQEFGVETMTFSNTSITIQPNGVASDTLGVTLTARNTTRHVSMTRIGLIQRTQ